MWYRLFIALQVVDGFKISSCSLLLTFLPTARKAFTATTLFLPAAQQIYTGQMYYMGEGCKPSQQVALASTRATDLCLSNDLSWTFQTLRSCHLSFAESQGSAASGVLTGLSANSA